MGILADLVVRVGTTGKALTINELARYEAWESIYNKMKRMYRLDKKKFTLRLSSVEASALWDLVNVAAGMNCGCRELAFISGVVQSLDNQICRELNIFNYNRN